MNMPKIAVLLLLLIGIYSLAMTGLATWIEWPVADGGNGHYYNAVLVPEGITWNEANSIAKGMGGHLVTITSEDENEFVYNLVSNDDRFWYFQNNSYVSGPWLGGVQDSNLIDPKKSKLEEYRKGAEVGWVWVTGEPFVFTKWANAYDQPDNIGIPESNGNFEDKLMFLGKSRKEPYWNDLASTCQGYNGPCGDKTKGFIVEFEEPNYGNDTPSIVTNGDFEAPKVTDYYHYACYSSDQIEGWMIDWVSQNKDGSACVELLRNEEGVPPLAEWAVGYWKAAKGIQCAELDSNSPVRIYQDLPTIPGAVYNLSFAFSPRPAEADNRLEIKWANSTIDVISADGSNKTNTDWKYYTYSVAAVDNSTRLEFADKSTPNGMGTFIDNVEVKLLSQSLSRNYK